MELVAPQDVIGHVQRDLSTLKAISHTVELVPSTLEELHPILPSVLGDRAPTGRPFRIVVDGSTVGAIFVSESIDVPSLTYLCTVADGQVIPNPPR